MSEKLKARSRILIADDNGPNVELLEAYLSGLDCEIAVAVDGRRASSSRSRPISLDLERERVVTPKGCASRP